MLWVQDVKKDPKGFVASLLFLILFCSILICLVLWFYCQNFFWFSYVWNLRATVQKRSRVPNVYLEVLNSLGQSNHTSNNCFYANIYTLYTYFSFYENLKKEKNLIFCLLPQSLAHVSQLKAMGREFICFLAEITPNPGNRWAGSAPALPL